MNRSAGIFLLGFAVAAFAAQAANAQTVTVPTANVPATDTTDTPPANAPATDGTLSTQQVPPSATGTTAIQAIAPQGATVALGPVARNIGLTPEDVGVMDRRRPVFDAKGIPLGGFRLFPTMDVIGTYDDNVFRRETAASDFYIAETPQLRLESQWGRHFFEIFSGLDNLNYADNPQLNLTDWTVGTDGRLDIVQGASVSGMFSYGRSHESLESPDTVGLQDTPNRSFVTKGSFSSVYQPNRLGVQLSGNYTRTDWSSTTLTNGAVINNADRNEDEYQATARVLYDFSPGYTGFLQGGYDSRSFDVAFDRTGAHRASTGYRANGGVQLQLSHLVQGEVYVGYLEQHYAQNVPIPLNNVAGPDFGASLDWFATPVLTAHLYAAHTLDDVTISRSAVSNNEIVRLSADYEYAYDTIVQAYVSYTHSRYTGTTRVDEYPGAGVTLKYLINRYFSTDLGYSFSERTSDVAGVEFNDNLISLTLRAHI